MGKRSDFERKPKDFYVTPYAGVVPLLKHLTGPTSFVEPCAVDGALIKHLEKHGHECSGAYDIDPQADNIIRMDAMELSPDLSCDYIITNPPWSRPVLHEMIVHFSDISPTWLLFDADWIHTKQSIPYLPRLRKIVSVGRLKWFPDSKMSGKDNAAWYLFDLPVDYPSIRFYGRE